MRPKNRKVQPKIPTTAPRTPEQAKVYSLIARVVKKSNGKPPKFFNPDEDIDA